MTTDWKQVEVSCECGLTIEFQHWSEDPAGFHLMHDPKEKDPTYIGGHILRHRDLSFRSYISYIDQMIVVKEPARA
ncbi:hypothetical protein LCGC14_0695250 [marine sediment metagenome]|uniref:Uncharacterized protein n=1 Tax=marine sediment metagenome TaxID=412755 RepID=A0A0F9QP43_9ZZZZ